MITTHQIQKATNTVELESLLEQAAFDRNCELDSSMTYSENAEFLRQEAPKSGNGEQSMLELVDILEAAEARWFELEA